MIGRVLYGAAFVVVLPVLLGAWAWALDSRVAMPAVRAPAVGAGLLAGGLALMAAAMVALRVHGGGLPMNAYPPPRLVTRGVYRLLPHPIYVGFVLACAGASVAVGSPAGLWVVTPLAAAGCAALVWGHELHDLARRFGSGRARPLLSIPGEGLDAPSAWERASAYVLVLLPWLVLYEMVGHVPVPGAVEAYLPFERGWPVIQWTEAVYAAVYPLAVLAPLAARTRTVLRRFCVAGLVGTAAGMIVYLAAPVIAPPRSFMPEGVLGRLLELERADGLAGRAAFPSFHVFWALLGAWVWSRRGGPWAWGAWALAAGIIASCVTTGMHALADLAGGVVLFVGAFHAGELWEGAVRWTERVANSWREWRIGPVRVINHGAYAGLGAFVGVWGAGVLVGPERAPYIALVAVLALAGAGLWGQYWVGSRTLLRPFGYYGSVLGAVVGLAVAAWAGAEFWVLAAALATVAPWVQAVGRLRCLVQGCCHGAPAEGMGVRYLHPRSRVCRISGLEGVPVHPTPLYSIVGNTVAGLLLARLWSVGAAPPLVAGAYLLLAGLARFVEESYRGEVQTPVVGGLRLYQWFAAASVAAGCVLTVAPCGESLPRPEPGLLALVLGLGAFVVYGAAMGVDAPGSNRRFSRLA